MLQPSRTHQTADVLTSTASIQFANGSAQDIVKIEGGIPYKEMMRWLSNTNDVPISPQQVTDQAGFSSI